PRVLIANSNLVPAWATWENFRKLEAAGLTMFGQMTAGSWIYIGTQGILQGTYETFVAAARTHYGRDDLAGKRGASCGARGTGRHGRRAAFGGDDGRRRLPRHRGRSAPHRAPPRDPFSRRARRLARRCAAARRAPPQERPAAQHRALRKRRRRLPRARAPRR